MAVSETVEVMSPGSLFDEEITLRPPEAMKLVEDGIYTLDVPGAVAIDVDSNLPWYLHFVQRNGCGGIVSNLTTENHCVSGPGTVTVVELIPGINEIYFTDPGRVSLRNFVD